MADELYVKVGSTIEPVALEADTAPEFVERIEAVEEAVPALDSSLRALIAQEVAKCLKLTGGVMTGVLDCTNVVHANNAGELTIRCGTNYTDGADFVLCGKDHPILPGMALLRSFNSAGSGTLAIQGNAFTINGNPILTSAGGMMTGSLLLSDILSWDNDGTNFYGGDAWRTGGYIELGGPNHTYPNHVQIAGGSRQTLEDLGAGWHINGSPIVTLASSWRSGNDWYRKYSDGWIEQGGEMWVSGTGNHSISLNTPFSITVYTVVASQATLGSSGGEWVNGQAITGRATTHFNVYDVHSGGHTILWYACGY